MNLLSLARFYGTENVSRLTSFLRLAECGKFNKVSTHLQLPIGDMRALPASPEQLKEAVALFPQLTQPGIKSDVKAILKVTGQKSGEATYRVATRSAEGKLLQSGTIKAAKDPSQIRVSMEGRGQQNLSVDADVVVPLNNSGSKTSTVEQLVRGTKYKVENGVAQLHIPQVKVPNLNINHIDVQADKNVFDGITSAATDGNYRNFGQLIQDGKNRLG